MKLEKIFGIWADATAILVVTSKLMLFFEKLEEEIIVYSCDFKVKTKKIIINLRAGINFNENKKTFNCIFNNIESGNLIQWGNKNNVLIEPQRFELDFNDNYVSDISNNLCIQLTNENTLNFTFFNNINHKLKLVDKIEITDFEKQPKATKNNLGYCLTNWNKLGIIEQFKSKKEIFSCRIILSKCDFNLNIVDQEMVYCNSNLQLANNNGKVWDQKIRLMNHIESNQFTILYPENCYTALKSKLFIDDSLFVNDRCNFLPGMLRYWSIDSFSDDQIIINGCGDKYTINRITEAPTDEENIEFFK